MSKAALSKANRYRHRVTIERRIETPTDPHGSPYGGWAALMSCWATIKGEPGEESVSGGAIRGTTRATIGVRTHTASLGITAADRVRVLAGPFSNLIGNITSIVPGETFGVIVLHVTFGVAT